METFLVLPYDKSANNGEIFFSFVGIWVQLLKY